MYGYKKERFKGYEREVTITVDLKDEYERITGTEEFMLNADGNLLFSRIKDVNGGFVSEEENKFDKTGKIKKHYFRNKDETERTEFFYNKKGMLIREKTTTERDSINEKSVIESKFNSKGKLKHIKGVSTLYDENKNIIHEDIIEEDAKTGFPWGDDD